MRQRVTVKVPATTANMGPGFDCLGMALDIWNTVRVELGSEGLEISGEGEDTLPRDESNLIHESLRRAFSEAGQPFPKARIICHNQIPLGRGLGSSTAAVLGALVAGNELSGRAMSQTRLLHLAAKVEGHPDNAAAALLGGCQIAVWDDDRLITSAVPVPKDLWAVAFVPDMPMPTEQARDVLPANVARQDAVYNIGRVALLVRAFSTGDLAHLSCATDDRLHQPARLAIFPAMKNIIRAALAAGALGAFLSGAGSSVLALSQGREITIGYEMAEAAKKSGVEGTLKITRPTDRGAHVEEESSGVED